MTPFFMGHQETQIYPFVTRISAPHSRRTIIQSTEAQNGLLVKVEYIRSPFADYCYPSSWEVLHGRSADNLLGHCSPSALGD